MGLAVLVALVAFGRAAPAGPLLHVERGEVGGDAAQAVLPPDGVPVRAVVLYLHGVTETAAATTDEPDLRRVVAALAGAGFVVVSSDAEGDSFGSPAARAVYLQTVQFAAARYGTHATFLLAESMGGLSAVPLAASGQVPHLMATVGINAAVNTASSSSLDFRAAATTAWGYLPTAADSPLALPATDFAQTRFRFYLAHDDTVVPSSENAEAFADHVAGVADVQLVGCSGDHVDPSCFRPDEVVRYFSAFLPVAPPPLRAFRGVSGWVAASSP